MFKIVEVCVDSLPGPAQTTLSYLTSEAFALPLLLAEVYVFKLNLSSLQPGGSSIHLFISNLVGSDWHVKALYSVSSVILTSYVSRGRANRKNIERLKDMLVMVRRVFPTSRFDRCVYSL